MTSESLASELCSGPPWLMGVVNATPDSFSDGGRAFAPEDALSLALDLKRSGAHIIDVGGESTAPGARPVSTEEELSRIREVIAALCPQVFVSVDTYKSEVAEFCLCRGARMINDVSGLRADSKMSAVIRQHNAFVVIMHSKESAEHPGASDTAKDYSDVISETADFLEERAAYALAQGISRERIILDPGMGRFLSHDPRYSWEILRRFSELTARLPFPVLIGASRKGFLGGSVEQRDPLSQLVSLAASLKGAQILRTHNIAMMRQFLEAWNLTQRFHEENVI